MDIEYLKTSIGGYLSRALTELAIKRPERPIEYLAYYLIALHEKELETQKAQEQKGKKKKSTSRVKIAAPKSSTNQIVSTMLSEIKDKCSDLYDPEVKDSGFSTSRVKVAAPRSSTNQIVSSMLSEIMDKCSDLYDPEVKDSTMNILEPSVIDIPDRRLTAPTIIDDVSYLDQNIANLIIDDKKEYTAELQNEMPHSYKLNPEAPQEKVNSLSLQVRVSGTSNNLQIDSD